MDWVLLDSWRRTNTMGRLTILYLLLCKCDVFPNQVYVPYNCVPRIVLLESHLSNIMVNDNEQQIQIRVSLSREHAPLEPTSVHGKEMTISLGAHPYISFRAIWTGHTLISASSHTYTRMYAPQTDCLMTHARRSEQMIYWTTHLGKWLIVYDSSSAPVFANIRKSSHFAWATSFS